MFSWRWWRRRPVPLECHDKGNHITFNRVLTADEIRLLRFAWEKASRGNPRHTFVQDGAGIHVGQD